jgi:hypothetical protein
VREVSGNRDSSLKGVDMNSDNIIHRFPVASYIGHTSSAACKCHPYVTGYENGKLIVQHNVDAYNPEDELDEQVESELSAIKFGLSITQAEEDEYEPWDNVWDGMWGQL